MHVNQVIWHEEYIEAIWETLHRCFIMSEVIHKEVSAGGRLNFFLDSVYKYILKYNTSFHSMLYLNALCHVAVGGISSLR